MSRGILYVMTTVVDGLIKIGKTGSANFESRMYNLEHNGYANVTGLKRRFAIEVDDYEEKEKLLDNIFEKSNVKGTELFAVDINIAVQLLSSFDGRIVYPKIGKEKAFDEAADAAAMEAPATIQDTSPARRVTSEIPDGTTPSGIAKRFHFSMVGIEPGAELILIPNPAVKVIVADDSHVNYKGEKWSMSALAQKLLGKNYPVQGTSFFSYKGIALTKLREQKELPV